MEMVLSQHKETEHNPILEDDQTEGCQLLLCNDELLTENIGKKLFGYWTTVDHSLFVPPLQRGLSLEVFSQVEIAAFVQQNCAQRCTHRCNERLANINIEGIAVERSQTIIQTEVYGAVKASSERPQQVFVLIESSQTIVSHDHSQRLERTDMFVLVLKDDIFCCLNLIQWSIDNIGKQASDGSFCILTVPPICCVICSIDQYLTNKRNDRVSSGRFVTYVVSLDGCEHVSILIAPILALSKINQLVTEYTARYGSPYASEGLLDRKLWFLLESQVFFDVLESKVFLRPIRPLSISHAQPIINYNRASTMQAEQIIEAPEKQTNSLNKAKNGFEMHSVMIPPNRMTPLKNNWEKICETVVKNMKLQVRMNMKKKTVDIRQCEETEDRTAIQRTYDFLRAFMLGFNLEDAIAMLRLDDLFLETFQIKDVKTLQGDHLSRCIARISGEKGKTKNAIENATKTRIILADSTIHLMGSFANMKSARDSLCSLIMGTPPGKVYSQLKYVSKRLNEKF